MITPATDDTTLMSLIAQGRSEALSELYDRYYRLVFSLALAIVADGGTAEEITLDVFVAVWQRAGTYRADRSKVSTWLMAVTRNHAIDILRYRGSRPDWKSVSWDHLPAQAIDNPHETEEHAERSLQRARIQAAISQLPAEQREALTLAYFGGYTHQQIAERLNQSLGTVKTRIRLAVQKLRHLMHDLEEPTVDKSE